MARAAGEERARAMDLATRRSTRYIVTGVALAAVGVIASVFLDPVGLVLAAIGAVIAFLGLAEWRVRRRRWHSYELVAEPDGITTVFQVATPFAAGTLIVFVDGIAHATVVEHPASGSFALGWAPEVGSSLEASWREA